MLTDSIQHNAVPALFSQSELSVELKLNSVVSPHLMSEEENIITNYLYQTGVNIKTSCIVWLGIDKITAVEETLIWQID